MLSRRELLGCAVVPGLVRRESEIPLADYHVHLDVRRGHTIDWALALSKQRGVKFGIVEHAGSKDKPYPNIISNDAALKKHIDSLASTPFYKGVQAEGLEWFTNFSPAAIAQLDYVLTDALTVPEKDGSFTELWRPWVKVADPHEFMERYVDFHLQILEREPIDILANPLFLPQAIAKDFDALWPPARMKKIVAAAAKYKVAIELNEAYRLPGTAFIKLAREAGLQFSFGSNQHNDKIGQMDYATEVIRTFDLKPSEIWKPAPFGRKPVQLRKL
jgi:histidinol phosphatase-like PHP family hydrolase